MSRKSHPAFEEDSRWLQELLQQVPATFDDFLEFVGSLGDLYPFPHPVRDGDAVSFMLWSLRLEVFRQNPGAFSRAAWLSCRDAQTSIEAVVSRWEELGSRIQVFNRDRERQALAEFSVQHPEIKVYPADQDFVVAMPEPRAFFEAAELRHFRVVVDRRSSLVLEYGADSVCRFEKLKSMTRQPTGKVIEAGLRVFEPGRGMS